MMIVIKTIIVIIVIMVVNIDILNLTITIIIIIIIFIIIIINFVNHVCYRNCIQWRKDKTESSLFSLCI